MTTINLLIDPFTIHQTSSIPKVNQIKTTLGKHERLFQAIEVTRRKPHAIFLGSSRVRLGLSTENLKAITHQDTYNLAFSGADFEEIFHYFEHALYHQPELKVVIIGLDFTAFNRHFTCAADFRLDRLKNHDFNWRDFSSSLFSLGAFKNSITTFLDNFSGHAVPYQLAQGEVLADDDPKTNPILRKGNEAYIKRILFDCRNYEVDEKKIDLFRKIVTSCKERGITLKCFCCPTHAVYSEALYRSHLWDHFEDLKRKLCNIHPIWDFSGFNSVTTRSLEAKQSFFVECSHFKPIVGNMIIDKMFDRAQQPSDFGLLLNPETIESTLVSLRHQAENWLQDHENVMIKLEKAQDWYQ